eukprot:CAMPEP_0114391854 /NCGR_PEP_ID=MMETSP0102-20121206/10392_1 /TAXON_ID=38822 ORGANISM="Pteridomonas danica, Strain PT" /NCGR_SAMPLE_ID=MMETSP0102 /ASSEMBLY_ACC=CAM_ASM_000212 /LENGTH=230 /DNA_ID=CAMNT_0001550805 /DNA_START=1 /DNA_END=693 /DNA_ORIENTATION=+
MAELDSAVQSLGEIKGSSSNREEQMKGMSPEQREKFLEEEAQAKAHDDQKTRHVLKTTGLFRGGGNPLKNGGGRGGRGGPRRATINIPPVNIKADQDPLPVVESISETTEDAVEEPSQNTTTTTTKEVTSTKSAEEQTPQSPSNEMTAPPPPMKFDDQSAMLAGMNQEQREAYLLEQAKSKQHEDMRTRHVLKTTGIFRAPGGNPLKAGGGRGGKGRRTSILCSSNVLCL